jgi:NADH:ubiquinone oxidoreductase subunit C
MSLSHEREDNLTKTIKENFPADIKEATTVRRSRINVTVAPEKITDIAIFLRDKLGYDHPSGVSAVDYNREARFEIVYHLSTIQNPDQQDIIINLKTSIARNNPRTTSLVKVWPGVDNYERESLEMFGIQFDGHPHPEKLFLNDNWDGPPPMRKEVRFPTD